MQNHISRAVFSNLNLIRALSGLVVVFSHYFQLFVLPVAGRPPAVNFALGVAEYAVLTFFVLSGFLIALSIHRNIQKHGRFDWKAYLVSRVARIYPPLIASVLLCILLHYFLAWLGHGGAMSLVWPTDVYPTSRTEFSLSGGEVVFTLLQAYAFGPGGYLTANGPLWSLSYEVGFYLAAGLLIVVYNRQGFPRMVGVTGLAVLGFSSIWWDKVLFLHYGTVWILGVGLFFILNTPGNEHARVLDLGRRRLRNVALLFGLLSLINLGLAGSGWEGEFIHSYLASTFIAIGLFGVSQLRGALLGRLAKLSDSTYTLYLFHFPLMLFAYALIRDLFDVSPAGYFTGAAILAAAIVPLCLALAKLLENRRLWEGFLKIIIR